MTPEDTRTPSRRGRPGPDVSAPTKVNVAFPFAKITVAEASTELAELSAIVVDLVAAVSEAVPAADLAAVRTRAEALSKRVR